VKEKHRNINVNSQFWQRVALVAGIFSFVICILIIANFIQINKADPINTETINTLVQKLNEDPSNNELREEIRVLDLLARKAYFTNQWQIRTGGYLLLLGVAIVIISMQMIIVNKKPDPQLSEKKGFDLMFSQKITRRWVSIGGGVVVTTALVFAYLTHQNLGERFNSQLITDEVSTQNVVSEDFVEEESQPINEDAVEEVIIEDTLQGNEVEKEEEKLVVDENIAKEAHLSMDHFMNFRGPGGLGVTTQKNLPESWNGETGENILWKTKIPLRGFNSPVIWEGKIFMSGGDKSKQEIYCIDQNTGNFLWTYLVEDVTGSPENPPEVANYTGYTAPSTATDGESVFAIFANGDMVALNMDGGLIWAKNLGVPQNHYGYSSSLICYKDKVIVQYDQRNKAKVLALSTKTGAVLWDMKRDVKISWSSPVIINFNGQDELILLAEPFVISYNPDTGEEKWKLDCISGEVGPSPAYANGVMYTVNDYSKLSAIKMGTTPEILWENEEFLSDVPSPVAKEEKRNYIQKYFLMITLVFMQGLLFAQQRFPKPEFESGHTQPDTPIPLPRADWLELLDVFVLIVSLSLITWIILKKRSRKGVFWMSIFSIIYFGFIREGCVCSVGSLQNITLALFHPDYKIPITVIAFFVIPIIYSLFFGRTFCAGICPLGAIQDVFVIKPIALKSWANKLLGMFPYIYLGLAVLYAFLSLYFSFSSNSFPGSTGQ